MAVPSELPMWDFVGAGGREYCRARAADAAAKAQQADNEMRQMMARRKFLFRACVCPPDYDETVDAGLQRTRQLGGQRLKEAEATAQRELKEAWEERGWPNMGIFQDVHIRHRSNMYGCPQGLRGHRRKGADIPDDHWEQAAGRIPGSAPRSQ